MALIFATWRKSEPERLTLAPQQTLDSESKSTSTSASNPAVVLKLSGSLRVDDHVDTERQSPSYEQVATGLMEEENRKSLDLYGVVVDQYGKPVVGAKIRGAIGYNNGPVSSSGEFRYTETDTEGRFNFLGIHGAGIGIWPTRDGYYYNPKLPSTTRPDDYSSDPSNPLKLVMWKLKGAEPMKHISFESRVPYDGTSVGFNLQTGKKTTDDSGGLQVSLLRSPQQIAPGLLRPYDWQVKIALANGGIIEVADLYPYQATEGGYQALFETTMSSNSVPWQAEFSRNFYIKNAQGQYGFLRVDISTNSKRLDTGIKVEASINPSGSRNLEPDFLK